MKIRILEDVDGHYMKVFGVPGFGTQPVYFSTMFDAQVKFNTIMTMLVFAEISYFLRVGGPLVC
jgi:hypothetical protein